MDEASIRYICVNEGSLIFAIFPWCTVYSRGVGRISRRGFL